MKRLIALAILLIPGLARADKPVMRLEPVVVKVKLTSNQIASNNLVDLIDVLHKNSDTRYQMDKLNKDVAQYFVPSDKK